ncbi:MAG TPA: YwiC-like family protein [Polyangiaceae bacterium]|nr:YwiC-like family protein [Polyangiaceae bacterium]
MKMWPKEHGAYAELALPLVATFAASRPTVAGLGWAIAACAAFVAHEPLLVLLGHRGTRARREGGPTARRWLAVTSTVALAAAAHAFTLAPAARPWMLVPAALAAAAGVLVVMRRERTLGGEIVVGAALTSAALPTAIAGSLSAHDAIGVWIVFAASFALSTAEVRVIARRDLHPAPRVAVWCLTAAAAAAVLHFRPFLAISLAPTLAVVTFMVVTRPRPASLRRLGWLLVGASLMTTASAVAMVRVSAV